MSIVEMGLIDHIVISDRVVTIALRLTTPSCLMVGHFKSQATDLIGNVAGVDEVRMTFDAGLDWTPEMISPDAQARRARQLAVMMPLPVVPSTRGPSVASP